MKEFQENLKVVKAGIWYTFSGFLARGIGFITTPFFSRILTHDEFGLFDNIISWLGILTICLTLYLESTFISARFDYENTFDEYILSILCLSSTITGFFAILINVFYELINSILIISRFQLNCILLYLLFLPAISFFLEREKYRYNYICVAIISFVLAFLTGALSVLLAFVSEDRILGRLIGYIVPSILLGVGLYGLIIKDGKRVSVRYWGYALKICIPYVPHLLSLTALNYIDRIMITKICGPADNALYSLAYTCGAIGTIFLTSLNASFSPWLGEKLHSKQYAEIKKASYKYIVLFLIVAVLLMLFAPEMLLILGGETYVEARYLIPPIACGCIFQFLYTMFVNVEQFNKKTIGMALASISAALLNFILNMIFIPRYGYVAAAYTTLIGYLWLLLIHMLLVFIYGFKEVYSYVFVICVVLISFLITFMVSYLYLNIIIRYLFIVLYLVLIAGVSYKYKLLSVFRKRG